MFTYREIKQSPSGWKDLKMEENEPGLIDFELALSQLLDLYRNKEDRAKVVAALEAQGQLVSDDESWTESEPSETEDSAEEGEA